MEMTIREALFMFSTAIALPVVAVLTFAFFTGGIKRTEAARFLPVMEKERDWWSAEELEARASGGARGGDAR
jgi:hypothetical protein